MIKIGQSAPDFALLNQDNILVSKDDFQGKNLVIYFYPKALTPGCTTQACGLQNDIEIFRQFNTSVVGVSIDTPDRLKRFSNKYNLEFDLLSDSEHKLCDLYGTWQLKKFMGREYLGVVRSSFILDKQGILRAHLEKVSVKSHNDDLLTFIKEHLV